MAKKNLADELALLEAEEQQEAKDSQAEVEQENQEAAENTPEALPDLSDLVAAKVEPELPETEPAENPDLYWEGIIHPDYRLKTVYVPIAYAPSKANGYDPDFGESFVYTQVNVMHKPPGHENHRRDTFNVRVDTRSVVPAFVAEQLGERADSQDYWG